MKTPGGDANNAQLANLISMNRFKEACDLVAERFNHMTSPDDADLVVSAVKSFEGYDKAEKKITDYHAHVRLECLGFLVTHQLRHAPLVSTEQTLIKLNQFVHFCQNTVKSSHKDWRVWLCYAESLTYDLCANYLMEKARKGLGDVSCCNKFAAVCFLHSLHALRNWRRQDTAVDRRTEWQTHALFVRFEAAQCLQNLMRDEGYIYEDLKDGYSGSVEKSEVLHAEIFPFQTKSLELATSMVGSNVVSIGPELLDFGEKQAYDYFIEAFPHRSDCLTHVLWSLLHFWDVENGTLAIEVPVMLIFESLSQFAPADMTANSVDSFSQLDVQVFLHMSMCCAMARECCVSRPVSLCNKELHTDWQQSWWHSAVSLMNNRGKAHQRPVLQQGLEIIRLLRNQAMELRLVYLVAVWLDDLADQVDPCKAEQVLEYADVYWQFLLRGLESNIARPVRSYAHIFSTGKPPLAGEEREQALWKSRNRVARHSMAANMSIRSASTQHNRSYQRALCLNESSTNGYGLGSTPGSGETPVHSSNHRFGSGSKGNAGSEHATNQPFSARNDMQIQTLAASIGELTSAIDALTATVNTVKTGQDRLIRANADANQNTDRFVESVDKMTFEMKDMKLKIDRYIDAVETRRDEPDGRSGRNVPMAGPFPPGIPNFGFQGGGFFGGPGGGWMPPFDPNLTSAMHQLAAAAGHDYPPNAPAVASGQQRQDWINSGANKLKQMLEEPAVNHGGTPGGSSSSMAGGAPQTGASPGLVGPGGGADPRKIVPANMTNIPQSVGLGFGGSVSGGSAGPMNYPQNPPAYPSPGPPGGAGMGGFVGPPHGYGPDSLGYIVPMGGNNLPMMGRGGNNFSHGGGFPVQYGGGMPGTAGHGPMFGSQQPAGAMYGGLPGTLGPNGYPAPMAPLSDAEKSLLREEYGGRSMSELFNISGLSENQQNGSSLGGGNDSSGGLTVVQSTPSNPAAAFNFITPANSQLLNLDPKNSTTGAASIAPSFSFGNSNSGSRQGGGDGLANVAAKFGVGLAGASKSGTGTTFSFTPRPVAINQTPAAVASSPEKSVSFNVAENDAKTPDGGPSKSSWTSPRSKNDSTCSGGSDYDPHFEPVVPLPDKVEVKTGEEGETMLFTERAKLYRWATPSAGGAGEWKERGKGLIKILEDPATNKCRVVMRREHVHKICANHTITGEMELKPFKNRPVCWIWLANDFSDDEPELIQLCVRFRTKEIAESFREVFEKARDAAGGIGEVEESRPGSTPVQTQNVPISSTTTSTAFTGKPQLKSGEGLLPTPSSNPDSVVSKSGFGIIADKLRFGQMNKVQPESAVATPSSASSAGFGKSFSFNPSSTSTPQHDIAAVSGGRGGLFGTSAAAAASKPMGAGSNPTQLSVSIFGGAPKEPISSSDNVSLFGGAKSSQSAASGSGSSIKFAPPTFVASEATPPAMNANIFGGGGTSIFGGTTAGTGSTPASGGFSHGGFSFSQPPTIIQPKKNEETKKAEAVAPAVTTSAPMFGGLSMVKPVATTAATGVVSPSESRPVFGSGSTMSFSSLAQQKSSFLDGSNSGNTSTIGFGGFQGAGTPLFGSKKPSVSTLDSTTKSGDGAEEEYEPEVDFKPLVPLPELVEVKTGEEGLNLLFSENCKLYRFDTETKEFKERGRGLLKLLEDPRTGVRRVVMRREIVLKLCANHNITGDMELHPMSKSEQAFTWQAQDYSEGELATELLAAKFKNKDLALKFRKIFDESIKLARELKPVPSDTVNSVSKSTGDGIFGNSGSESGVSKPEKDSYADIVAKSAGKWECNGCMVKNDQSVTTCPCCGTVRDGAAPSGTSNTFGSGGGSGLGSVWKPSTTGSTPGGDGFKFGFGAVGSDAGGQPSATPDKMTTTTTADSSSVFSSFKFGFGSSTVGGVGSFGSGGSGDGAGGSLSVYDSPRSHNDSSGSITSPNDLRYATAPESDKTQSEDDEQKGTPSSYFGVNANSTPTAKNDRTPHNNEDEDPEAEGEGGPHFEPLVNVPEQETPTGEEDEETLFESRAKLFRFRDGEYKERGAGVFRILINPETGVVRGLLRRDQTLKLACNFQILPEMILAPKGDKSWVFFCMDFSEQDLLEETFAITFKKMETALEFQQVWNAAVQDMTPAVSPLKAAAQSKSTPVSSPSISTPPVSHTPTTGSLFGGVSGVIVQPSGPSSSSLDGFSFKRGDSADSTQAAPPATAVVTPAATSCLFGKSASASPAPGFGGSLFGGGFGGGSGDVKPSSSGFSLNFGWSSMFGGDVKSSQPEADQDLQLVYETQVSEEQRARAAHLKLPTNFYSFENHPKKCPGCVGCEESDESNADNESPPEVDQAVADEAGLVLTGHNKNGSVEGGSDDSGDVIFEKRVTLMKGTPPQNIGTGVGELTVVQDKETSGYRVVFNDDCGNTIMDYLVVRTAKPHVTQLQHGRGRWSVSFDVPDCALMPGGDRSSAGRDLKKVRAVFTSMAASKEFVDHFKQGVSLAKVNNIEDGAQSPRFQSSPEMQALLDYVNSGAGGMCTPGEAEEFPEAEE